jgi:hypothetical protein
MDRGQLRLARGTEAAGTAAKSTSGATLGASRLRGDTKHDVELRSQLSNP